MKVRFWGTRGSVPTPGKDTLYYGGNTLCAELRTDDNQILILDAGSGIFSLGQHILATRTEPVKANILLTHTHWDHIQGLPFFAPLYYSGNTVSVYCPVRPQKDPEKLLESQMRYAGPGLGPDPYANQIKYQAVYEGKFNIGPFEVTAFYLNHTALNLGYNVKADGKSVTYCTDIEPCAGRLLYKGDDIRNVDFDDPAFVSLLLPDEVRIIKAIRHSDLHIQDSMYTEEQYLDKVGWGHSTVNFAVELAYAACAKRFALFHHDPIHNDEEITNMLNLATKLASGYSDSLEVYCAKEGLEIEL